MSTTLAPLRSTPILIHGAKVWLGDPPTIMTTTNPAVCGENSATPSSGCYTARMATHPCLIESWNVSMQCGVLSDMVDFTLKLPKNARPIYWNRVVIKDVTGFSDFWVSSVTPLIHFVRTETGWEVSLSARVYNMEKQGDVVRVKVVLGTTTGNDFESLSN